MNSIRSIVARANTLVVRDEPTAMTPGVVIGIITLMVLIFVGLVCTGALYLIQRVRKSRAISRQQLPTYEPRSHKRSLTINTGDRMSKIYIVDDKSSTRSGHLSPPLSPENVPQIRITFPDEQDEAGHSKSGRVLVVRVGEKGIGLEPLPDEDQLPAYEKTSGERFQSLDMDRIGGLKEKSQWS